MRIVKETGKGLARLERGTPTSVSSAKPVCDWTMTTRSMILVVTAGYGELNPVRWKCICTRDGVRRREVPFGRDGFT